MEKWELEDKICCIANECDLPYNLTEELMRIAVSKMIARRRGETIQYGMETIPTESFINILKGISEDLNTLNWK